MLQPPQRVKAAGLAHISYQLSPRFLLFHAAMENVMYTGKMRKIYRLTRSMAADWLTAIGMDPLISSILFWLSVPLPRTSPLVYTKKYLFPTQTCFIPLQHKRRVPGRAGTRQNENSVDRTQCLIRHFVFGLSPGCT